jgi:aspartate/methionine/tyrosine aminotransferase
VLSGVSKLLGLPQWKLSWIAAAGPAALRDEALERLEVVADTFLSVNGPAQLGLPGLLARREAVQAEIRGRVRANLETLDGALGAEPGLSRLPADAGWGAILRLGAGSLDDEDVALALLEREGVLVHPGSLFELEGRHLALSLLPPAPRFRAGLDALLRGLRS